MEIFSGMVWYIAQGNLNIRIHKDTTGEGVWGRVRWKFSHHFRGGTNNGGRLTLLVLDLLYQKTTYLMSADQNPAR